MYQWFVLIHLVGLVLFVFAHGASAFTTFQIRTDLTLPRLLAGSDGLPPISGEALAAYLDSRRPDILGGVGALGFVVLVWLMVMKPG